MLIISSTSLCSFLTIASLEFHTYIKFEECDPVSDCIGFAILDRLTRSCPMPSVSIPGSTPARTTTHSRGSDTYVRTKVAQMGWFVCAEGLTSYIFIFDREFEFAVDHKRRITKNAALRIIWYEGSNSLKCLPQIGQTKVVEESTSYPRMGSESKLTRRLLFLGYSMGLQIWDCTDLGAVLRDTWTCPSPTGCSGILHLRRNSGQVSDSENEADRRMVLFVLSVSYKKELTRQRPNQ